MKTAAGGNLAASAFDDTTEPTKAGFVPGGHFAAYTGAGFAVASVAVRDWFTLHFGLG